MGIINLSYIITTKNKIEYLPRVIEKLIKNIQLDEEIVIVDAGSTDGTKEYLTELFKKKFIHKFLSEKDHAQAHGCNKALLIADGVLLKIINDDDMFYYEGIRKCKNFMLENKEIDIIGMDGAAANYEKNDYYFYSSYPTYLSAYKKWKFDRTPFGFCDLGLMIRKSSLSYLGLFNPSYICLDAEYTLRVSSLPKVKLAWYSGHCWVRMTNKKSLSYCNQDIIAEEEKKLKLIYLGIYPKKRKIINFKNIIKYPFKLIKRFLLKIGIINKKLPEKIINNYSIDIFFNKSETWLEDKNKEIEGVFYY